MVAELSNSIRKLRHERGMSLAELARLIGTSPATLCKYERGWHRFELYTLEKIAAALGCRLNVTFERKHRKVAVKIGPAAVKQLSRLFWDRKLAKADFRRYPVWVAERVLEYGSLEDVHTVVSLMGKKRFLRIAAQCKFSTPKTRRFWEHILGQEGIPCTKKFYPRTAWPS